MKYKQIYPWQAIDCLKNGQTVLLANFLYEEIVEVRDLTVDQFLSAQESEDNRYMFVVASEEEDEKDETL